MPSARAILRDISDLGLNPRKAYTTTTASGRLRGEFPSSPPAPPLVEQSEPEPPFVCESAVCEVVFEAPIVDAVEEFPVVVPESLEVSDPITPPDVQVVPDFLVEERVEPLPEEVVALPSDDVVVTEPVSEEAVDARPMKKGKKGKRAQEG